MFDEGLLFDFKGFIESFYAVFLVGEPFELTLKLFFHIAFVHLELFSELFEFLGEVLFAVGLGRTSFIIIINFLQKLNLFYQVLFLLGQLLVLQLQLLHLFEFLCKLR